VLFLGKKDEGTHFRKYRFGRRRALELIDK
jgi:hypothetical protein